jgi:nitronate monooxygenase
MNWKNDITEKLNTDYSIIQAPMFGVTTPEMVAAATKAGCLGSLPLGDLPVEKCRDVIRTTKQLSPKLFGVNLFANDIPVLTETLKAKYGAVKQFIENLAAQHGLTVVLPGIDEISVTSYHEQLDIILQEGIKVVSFTFGNLDQQSIQMLKDNGITLIGTCTSVEEAKTLEASGIDILCVQGLEAGGHRGSFTLDNVAMIGGMSLLSQVFDAVKVPLVYAGGIYNSRTLLAAKALGAKGFQVGSLLLGSAESALKEFEKERLRNVKENEIVLTKSFSGRYARGIKNAFIEAVEQRDLILPYPYQNKLTNELRKVAKANGNTDFVTIWLGQSINGYSGDSTFEILNELIAQTEQADRS